MNWFMHCADKKKLNETNSDTITCLKERPELALQCASLILSEFSDEYAQMGILSKEQLVDTMYKEYMQDDSIPIVFMSLRGDVVIATCTLDTHDMVEYGSVPSVRDPIREFPIWLADVVTLKQHRGFGTMSRLMDHAISFARSRASKLYLWTLDRERFFAKRGFAKMECLCLSGKMVALMDLVL